MYNAGNTLYITSDSDKETIYHVSVYDVTGCLQGGYTVASSSQTTAVELNIVKNHAYIIKVTTDQKEAVTRLYY